MSFSHGPQPKHHYLLLLYAAGMVNRYGSGLQARLDQLVALGNQAYNERR